MDFGSPSIRPLGEGALVVEFGRNISEHLNIVSIELAQRLMAQPFAGFVEAVPAYASTTVYFDPAVVARTSDKPAHETVSSIVSAFCDAEFDPQRDERELIEIPTDFTAAAGLDLEFVAQLAGLKVREIINIFLERTYRVYMIGFLPGFAYMGETDKRINVPRRTEPRTEVPKGSVGLAGSQCGIYPLRSPGGWQIIGRTQIELFTPHSDPPVRLQAGDSVRFVEA